MIYCKIDRLDRYLGLSGHLDTAIRFLQRSGAAELPMGRTEIDGDAVYVNRFAYDTVEEPITEGLREVERKEEEDYIGFSGPFQSVCVMVPGDVLITFPEDAHSPKRQHGASCHVEKAVIKVLAD